MSIVDGLVTGIIAAILNWLFSLREGRPAVNTRSASDTLATLICAFLAATIWVGLAKMVGFGSYAQYSLQQCFVYGIIFGVVYVVMLMLIFPDRSSG